MTLVPWQKMIYFDFSSLTRNRPCFNPICKSEMARSDAWPIGPIIQSSSDRTIWAIGAIWGAIWGATNEANGWSKPHFATLQACKLHLQETFWMRVHDVTKCNLRSKKLGQKASWIRLSRMGKQSKDATLEIEDIRRQAGSEASHRLIKRLCPLGLLPIGSVYNNKILRNRT